MAPALIVSALVIGMTLGWVARMHVAHDKYLAGMAAWYQAQEAWLQARTAEMMADLDRDVKQVKADMKTTSKEVKRGKKTD